MEMCRLRTTSCVWNISGTPRASHCSRAGADSTLGVDSTTRPVADTAARQLRSNAAGFSTCSMTSMQHTRSNG